MIELTPDQLKAKRIATCKWTLAKPPQGIAPAAFSWLDCTLSRRYGYPATKICDKCNKVIVFQ